MTLAEIDETLPNGFHDAEIELFNWNFQQDSAYFDIEFWIAGQEDADREKRRHGRVELRRIAFLAIDPPSARLLDPTARQPTARALQIDGVVTDEKIFPELHRINSDLPSETQIFSFYVVNWNSFIHIAAAEASLIWREP